MGKTIRRMEKHEDSDNWVEYAQEGYYVAGTIKKSDKRTRISRYLETDYDYALYSDRDKYLKLIGTGE